MIEYSETGIGHLIFEQAEQIRALEKKAERYDLAAAAIERALALEIAGGNRLISAGLVLELVGCGAQYGASGLKARCIGDALADLEAELRGPPM